MTSVIEWCLAIVLLERRGYRVMALAMLPALISAMAACTWHLFDNSESLRGLVVLQAGFTLLGNTSLAFAAWKLNQTQEA